MLEIGVIGAGRIGRTHIQCVQHHVRNARIRAVADPMCNAEMRDWVNTQGIAQATDDYVELLRDPQIDAVMICTPTSTHADLTITALRAGKHVFCEKPVAMNVEDIRRVAQEIHRSKKKYQIGFMQRFDHNYAPMIAAAASGAIGRVQLARITSRDPEPPSLEYIRSSGGIYLDMMIHDFDLARCFLNSEAVEVYAQGTCLLDRGFEKTGDVDTAVAHIKMENGAMAVVDNTRACAYGYDQRAEIFGTEGMISANNDIPSATILATRAGFSSPNPTGFFLERFMNAYAAETAAFVESVRSDAPVAVGIEDAYQDFVIAMAATLSKEENRPVQIREMERKLGVSLADIRHAI